MKVIHFYFSGVPFISSVPAADATYIHLSLIHFSHQPPCSAIIVMEGEGGLHWNNNKSVPLNTLDNRRALAFTELQRQALSVPRALHF